MAAAAVTYISCYDESKSLGDDVRKRFSDTSRYNVSLFTSKLEFLRYCAKIKENSVCKVAVVNMPDGEEGAATVCSMISEMKISDPSQGLIIVCRSEKCTGSDLKLKITPDAFITRNANSVLRIHNAVKKIISEYNIRVAKRRRNISLAVLGGFLVISIVSLIVTWIRFPSWF